MPRQLMLVKPGELGIGEYELPDLREGQVRVRPEFGSAKHGTEMAGFKGYAAPRGRYDNDLGVFLKAPPPDGPIEPYKPHPVGGNMFVCTVTELGSGVTGLEVGDRAL